MDRMGSAVGRRRRAVLPHLLSCPIHASPQKCPTTNRNYIMSTRLMHRPDRHSPFISIVARRSRNSAASFCKVSLSVAKSTCDFGSPTRFTFGFGSRLQTFNFLEAAGWQLRRARQSSCWQRSPVITGRYKPGSFLVTLSILRRFNDELQGVVHWESQKTSGRAKMAFMYRVPEDTPIVSKGEI